MKPATREIGSEFWDVPASEGNSMFYSDTVWFLSGRSALSAIISDIQKKRDVKTVALPAWCCDSMIVPFENASVEVRFYPVYRENGKFIKDVSAVEGCDILFSMDYFGYASEFSVENFDGIVIRDLTHSVFSKKYDDADYYFGSLRKWAGFLTGGFAWGIEDRKLPTDGLYTLVREKAMKEKLDYITGKSESKDYLKGFALAEEYLETAPLAGADVRDIEAARKLDVDGIKNQRRKNARILLDAVSDMAIFPKLSENDCPLFVPILVPNGKRDALRRHLIEQEIYCPVHWPLSEHHNPDERTFEIYENELSLVCDQRYDERDMERIVKEIRKF